MNLKHREFEQYRNKDKKTVVELPEHGIAICVLSTSLGFNEDKTYSRGRGLTIERRLRSFLDMSLNWRRVDKLPEDCVETMEIVISILGGVSLIHCKIGRKYLETFCGYVEILKIDDVDY